MNVHVHVHSISPSVTCLQLLFCHTDRLVGLGKLCIHEIPINKQENIGYKFHLHVIVVGTNNQKLYSVMTMF